jgi:hypothetical protein
MQSQLSSLRHELAVANTELRVLANNRSAPAPSAPRTAIGEVYEPSQSAVGTSVALPPARVTEDSAVQTLPSEEQSASDREQSTGSNPTMTAAARRSILATEAYVKDLHRQ